MNHCCPGKLGLRGYAPNLKKCNGAVVPIGAPGSEGILPSTANSQGFGTFIFGIISDEKESNSH